MKKNTCLLLGVITAVSLTQAGSLEPPGPPAPTMVSLESLPISWHQQLGLGRFEIVMNGEAVLDHETGLVWERVVIEELASVWDVAVRLCRTARTGNRLGWRLPSIEELATLVDLDQSNPALPPLHPFVAETSAGGPGEFTSFWTSSTSTESSPLAWVVWFDSGNVTFNNSKGAVIRRWCVRGSIGLDTGRP